MAPSTFFRVRTSVLARSFESRANLVLKVRNTHFGDGNLTRDSRALCALLHENIKEARRTN